MDWFDGLGTRESRAVQIWQILIGCAQNRQTITYEGLADLLGFKGAGVMGPFLDPLMYWCAQHGVPPLTVLVVGKYTGRPGGGLELDGDVDEERERVYLFAEQYSWYKVVPPTIEELTEALQKKKPKKTP